MKRSTRTKKQLRFPESPTIPSCILRIPQPYTTGSVIYSTYPRAFCPTNPPAFSFLDLPFRNRRRAPHRPDLQSHPPRRPPHNILHIRFALQPRVVSLQQSNVESLRFEIRQELIGDVWRGRCVDGTCECSPQGVVYWCSRVRDRRELAQEGAVEGAWGERHRGGCGVRVWRGGGGGGDVERVRSCDYEP